MTDVRGELLLDESESEWSPAWAWSDEPARKKGRGGERLEAVVSSSLEWLAASSTLGCLDMVADGSRDNASRILSRGFLV